MPETRWHRRRVDLTPMARSILVWLHRIVGLALAVFLVVVGLTGSLLAYYSELNKVLSPRLYPMPREGKSWKAGELATRAEALVPTMRVHSVWLGDTGTAMLRVEPRPRADRSKPSASFDQIYLDPLTGEELGRRVSATGWPSGWENLMPFVYRLHYKLAWEGIGMHLLGIVALLWTVDCFVGLYLTLPAMRARRRSSALPGEGRRIERSFADRWKPAWLVKHGASVLRLNFDLHRASGLWVWIALLVFAWSSVYMNLHDEVYAPVTRWFAAYPPRFKELPVNECGGGRPMMDWTMAQEVAERLMLEQTRRHGFSVIEEVNFRLERSRGVYIYQVRSDRDIQDRRGRTLLAFDACNGEFRTLELPRGQHGGLTLTMWLNALHDANVFGRPYQFFVFVLGFVMTGLSGTGVYLWWRKRRARRRQADRLERSRSMSAPGSPMARL